MSMRLSNLISLAENRSPGLGCRNRALTPQPASISPGNRIDGGTRVGRVDGGRASSPVQVMPTGFTRQTHVGTAALDCPAERSSAACVWRGRPHPRSKNLLTVPPKSLREKPNFQTCFVEGHG